MVSSLVSQIFWFMLNWPSKLCQNVFTNVLYVIMNTHLSNGTRFMTQIDQITDSSSWTPLPPVIYSAGFVGSTVQDHGALLAVLVR